MTFRKTFALGACVGFLTLAVFAGSVSAQQQYGELIVVVVDPTGAVIPAAEVELTSPALMAPRRGETDSQGIFRSPALPSGVYKATVTRPGFATAVREDINVEVGRAFTIQISMTVGALAKTVVVEAGGVQMDVVKSESATVFRGEELTDTPGGRDYTSFVNLLPSINIDFMSGTGEHKGRTVNGISVDGSSGAENVFYVDGIDTTSMYTGLPNQGLRPETVQEFQIKSSGYDAEFGGAMGGVMSAVTKSGSDAFHGDVFYYYGGSPVWSNPRRRLRLDPTSAVDVSEYTQDPEDVVNRNEFGVTLGGPIVREKAWFFASWMPTWTHRTREVDFTSGEHGIFKRNETLRNATVRLDFQPIEKLALRTSFMSDSFRWKGGLPTYDGTDDPTFDWARQGYKYPSFTVGTGATATLSPKFLVEARWGLNSLWVNQFLGAPGVRHRFMQSNGLIGYTSADSLYRPRYWAPYGYYDGYATDQDYQKKGTLSFGANWLPVAGGQHDIKFGYAFNRLSHAVNDSYTFDYERYYFGQIYTTTAGVDLMSSCTGPNGWVYDGVTDNDGDGRPEPPCGYYEVRDPFGVMARIHTDRHALYFQDGWTMAATGNRLTINAGIRFEKEAIPSFSDLPEFAGAAFTWGFTDKVAPRLGASFDVFGDRKLKIFGSYGWFYDAMKLEMANGSFGGFKWESRYYLMDDTTLDWTQIGDVSAGGDVWPAGNYPGTFVESRNWRIPSFEDLDPNIKPMRMSDIVAGMEWAVATDYVLSFRYVHKSLEEAIEDVGRQTPAGEAYYITNPGRGFSVSKFTEVGLPPTPDPKRTYNLWEFRLRKAFSNRWRADISYSYCRLRGLYSGLGSSDENGRLSPNVDRDFDLWFLNYDSHGNLIDGPLNTDRAHQVKILSSYEFPFGLEVGGFQRIMSGTPISRTADLEYVDIMVDNRGSDGRNPTWAQTDLYLVQAFHPFKDETKSLEFNVNIINLFNQKTALRTFRSMNREVLPLWTPGDPISNVLGGYDVSNIMAAQQVDLDPRFLQRDRFQERMALRLGVRILF